MVPAYRSGAGIDRVIGSLDAQTLPAAEFEVIVVDDGSPDDTFQHLQELAATRPNLIVDRIENSGWPSRPRNVGTRRARGEYLLFMDHDDSLYPDALRRAYEYAHQVGADLLNVKESKTSDAWWCMPALADGNSAEVKQQGRIDRLLPMVPHKVYRRQFLLDNDIRFPEGRRMLWEDVYFNIEAYAKAERIAVLADTPVYLWHASDSNNSATYGPRDDEFWDRLDDLMAFIDRTLSGPELASARESALLHQYRGRVLRRLGRALIDASPDDAERAMRRARQVQDRFIDPDWEAELGVFEWPRAQLLRQGRGDLLELLHTSYAAIKGRTSAGRVEWRDGVLELDLESRWLDADGHPVRFDRSGDRLLLRLPAELTEALPAERLDVTDAVHRFVFRVGVRARAEKVTWQLFPHDFEVSVDPFQDGTAGLTIHARNRFDPQTCALGAPVAATVWDVVAVNRWDGLSRAGAVRTDTEPRPALLSGVPAVAYRNKSDNLSIDLAQQLRSVARDGLREGRLPAAGAGFTLPLSGVAVHGRTDIAQPVTVGGRSYPGRLIGDQDGARVQLDERPAPGRVGFPVGDQDFPTRLRFASGRAGDRLSSAPEGSPASPWDRLRSLGRHLAKGSDKG
ncbi:MAG: glycosyltransferase [Micropruina sp.]|uniref:glycosyltransferase family 2 protein n=1 Tax=Micropruina sp. TaxID=2737536 RepID=UPI0039E53DAF